MKLTVINIENLVIQQAPNSAPIAVNDTAASNENTAINIVVLNNDSDPDGNPLSVSLLNTVSQQGASISLIGNTVHYDPTTALNHLAEGEVIVDQFQYQISDGQGGLATATVNVTVTGVNDLPIAVNDAAASNEDTAINIAVLSNDNDPDGDPLSLSFNAVSQQGAAISLIGNTVHYDPSVALNHLAQGQIVVDQFQYQIHDGHNGFATGTVNVTVTGVNDAPLFTATEPAHQAVAGQALNFVLPTATDVDDNDVLSYSVTMDGNPLPNNLVFDSNTRTLSGTPALADVGNRTIHYTVTDLLGATDTQDFLLSIGAPPTITLNVQDLNTQESNTGVSTYNLAVTISAEPLQFFTIQYTTQDGTATVADNDYQAVSGQLTFGPNFGFTQFIHLPIVGDTHIEGNETFTVHLSFVGSTPLGVEFLNDTSTVTIFNDDVAQPLFTTGNDTVNFNTVLAGQYIAGTQFNAFTGNDQITLPNTSAEATASGIGTGPLSGGDGDDIFTALSGATARLTLNGDLGSDTFNLNNAVTPGGDPNAPGYIVNGGSNPDIINGSGDADIIDGGQGPDMINGGPGNDTLTGGLGSDNFRFDYAGFGADTITDFAPGQDIIHIFSSSNMPQPVVNTVSGDSVVSIGSDSITLQGITSGFTVDSLNPQHFIIS